MQKLPQWETDFWSRLKLYHEIDNSLAGSTPKQPRSGAGGFPTLPLHVLPNLHSPWFACEAMFLLDLLGKVPVRVEPGTLSCC